MAVVTVTGTIEITLPSENTEEIDVFMKKYEHLTPYLFNGNISNDSFYSREKDYLERVKHISINKD